MGNTLYLECESGISGDMFVAALLDLGANQGKLLDLLSTLSVQGFHAEISRVKKAGLDACDFDVILDAAHENHDHDMQYLYGHLAHEQEHHHGDGHEHHHGDGHEHHHEHRSLPEILHIIRQSGLSLRAKQTAERIFEILAEAESKAHGVPADQVHFHEVGAVDSIVDVLSAAICLDDLDITQAVITSLCEGCGTVRCQHGILPVPVPAVANILQKHQIPMRVLRQPGEFVTPTGAAIVAAIRTSGELPGEFVVQGIGLGAGKREYKNPSILRAMLIQSQERQEDVIYKLETNIDDCTGEQLGYVMERLLEAGARDVHYLPVYMKKNRPAYELVVICVKEDVEALEKIIFKETTTIGIRRMKMERSILPRTQDTLSMDMGEVQVKKCVLPDGEVRVYPEYESISRLAKETDLSYSEIMHRISKLL